MHRLTSVAGCLTLVLLAFGLFATGTPNAHAAEVRKILLLHSYGRNTPPFAAFLTSFRSEMLHAWPEKAAFYDFSLESGRLEDGQDERATNQVLRSRFADMQLDLVVTIGAPATDFYTRNRDALFPAVPIMQIADLRNAAGAKLKPGDSMVGMAVSGADVVKGILDVLPETTVIAVIFGSSPGERLSASRFKSEFASLDTRVKFIWLDDLALAELRERVRGLGSGTVALYGLFQFDAEGIPYEQDSALKELHLASSVPMFGFFESQLGQGIVGGALLSGAQQGLKAASTASQVLAGQSPAQVAIVMGPTAPQFDWRALQRWKIDEKRLPPGSIVRFRPLSIWEEHRSAMIAGFAVLLLQAALILALIVQARARSRAEGESFALSWRLLTAHEDERRHLARELHDDVTQRLARLAIDAARFEALEARPDNRDAPSVHGGLVCLSEDVHALSYRLHPSILDDLGLAEALKAECEHVSRRGAIQVDARLDTVPQGLGNEVGLCIFRVAQEALQNVARHAHASLAIVSLVLKDDGLQLAVRDNGVGFDINAKQERHSLGRAGMGERVRLLGGKFSIMSGFGQGTTITAWVPLKGVSS